MGPPISVESGQAGRKPSNVQEHMAVAQTARWALAMDLSSVPGNWDEHGFLRDCEHLHAQETP
eukprot:10527777-Lingulodinium_polyedra.AAC.1